jgi:hypothetical protein
MVRELTNFCSLWNSRLESALETARDATLGNSTPGRNEVAIDRCGLNRDGSILRSNCSARKGTIEHWARSHSRSRRASIEVTDVRVGGHSRRGRAGSKSGNVRYAAGSGSKFRALAGPRPAIAGWWRCPRRDSSSKTGASNHALRTQRLRMDRHQTDAAE